MSKVLAFCLISEGELPRESLELIAAARKLADDLGDAEACAIPMGPGAEEYAQELIQRGADEVFPLAHERLQPYETEVLLGVAEQVVGQLAPRAILFPHDIPGSEVAPRLAYRLKTGVVTDCLGFEVTDGKVRWLKPVYGGKAMAYMVIKGPVDVATMRMHAFEPLPADESRQGAVRHLEVDVEGITPQVSFVERKVEEAEGISLDQARIIVSGGRGMGSPENFKVLEELAQVLKAAIGASRPVVDAGWLPHSRLIGQTGKIVAPDLYIAVGISGATQHMTGVGARTIVAINKDEDAPIFKQAHIGIIDRWENVLPHFIEACKKLTAPDTGSGA